MPEDTAYATPASETAAPEQLDGQSLDLRAQRLAALKALLPEAFDLDGNLVQDKLIAALKPATYQPCDDIPTFGLGWPGKQQAFAAAGVPTTATLRPCPEQSVDFEATQNLLIEGDNLEVLKTLQRAYHGKVKMIYIDPPYNTGSDFVYPDNYGEGLDTYLKRTRQKDEEGFWKSTNSETSGRKHATWLSMMAPRLTLAQNLLREDGVIFISNDDNEAANLKMLCDEVFGAENFIAQFIWEKRTNRENRRAISFRHDYVLCFRKSQTSDRSAIGQLPMSEQALASYQNPDNDPRGRWKSDPAHAQGGRGTATQFYTLTAPNGMKHDPPPGRCWQYTKEVMQKAIDEDRIWFGRNGDGVPRIKTYLDAKDRGLTPETIIFAEDASTNEVAKTRIIELFGNQAVFDTPKPVQLVEHLLKIGSVEAEQDLIVDFFAGSGTTGHAVMAQNAEDGGNRRYICVQLPEPLDEPVTLDDGVTCHTIFDLARERLKRAGKKIREEAGLNADKIDTGMRVFKLDSSNFTAWNSDPTTSEVDLLNRLDQLTDHTVPGRTEGDILWEVILKMGLMLDLQVERFELEEAPGIKFIGVADRTRVISTQTAIPTAALEALLDQDIPPSELVVLDSAFENDTARANIATLYKQRKDDDGKPVCNLRVV